MGDDILGYLHGIERGPLLYLVAYEPERQSVGVRQVFADAPDVDRILAGDVERHGVFLLGGNVDNHESLGLSERLAGLFGRHRTLGFHPHRLGMGAQHRHANTHRAHVEPGGMHDFLVSLNIFISSFV